jgi:exopolysaccharide production protein ExoQ
MANKVRLYSFLYEIVLGLIGLGTLAVGWLTPRDLSAGEALAEYNLATEGSIVFDLSRTLILLILALSVFVAVLGALSIKPEKARLRLLTAYLVFIIATAVIPIVASSHPGADSRLFYPLLILLGGYFYRARSYEKLLALARAILGAFVYVALVAAVLAPDKAVAGNYKGLFDFLNFRLYGVGTGATGLGFVASAYIIILFDTQVRGVWWKINMLVGTGVLFLTQAKTLWVAIAVLGLISMLGKKFSEDNNHKIIYCLMLTFFVIASTVIVGLLLGFIDVKQLFADDNIQTLTGRGYIWGVSLDIWRQNPIFGYGLGLWVDQSFHNLHGTFAHSHNQFIHALASSGVVGLAGLVCYLVILFRQSVKIMPYSPVPVFLLFIILVQGLTDVPLLNRVVLDAFLLVHIILFLLILEGSSAISSRGLPERSSTA